MIDAVIQLENKYYIATNSSYADDRILLINYSDTFGIFDRWGDVLPFGDAIQGLYHMGTRFLNESELRINGSRPTLLSSSIREKNEVISVDLTNEAFEVADKPPVAKGSIHLSRRKFLRKGSCHERFEIINYGDHSVEFALSLSFKADYADIFEVRGIKRDNRGAIFETRHSSENELLIRYRGLDNICRSTLISFTRVPDNWEGVDRALFNLSIDPHEQVVFECSMQFLVEKDPVVSVSFTEELHRHEEEMLALHNRFATVITSNEQFNEWMNRSQSDLISLLSVNDSGFYPYAGVPWYNTAFGRDGIITALETLWIAPFIAHDVLQYLAGKQAHDSNLFRNSDPGKILHEVRTGEMVELDEIPFKLYYGSIDSTPLFIVLAGAYYKRSGDKEFISSIWPNILAALNWIDKYSDIDGDGFAEYELKGENGLVNQGWKDSFDSVMDERGGLVAPPIALCEVQGYIYDAWENAAMLHEAFGLTEEAGNYRQKAGRLKERFHTAFWDDELRTYILALGPDKKPCRVIASNAGHCMFSGIASHAMSGPLVQTLTGTNMYSGWGIRTLSTAEFRFNPMSYHNGSVWPHDVAMIASGFARYGYHKEAMMLMTGLFDAALYIDQHRLPELFCGFERRKNEGPTLYPVACSPQAWSVAAIFMMLESCLHMHIDAPAKKVFFTRPLLPDFFNSILIEDIPLGSGKASFELHRYKDRIGLDVKENNSGYEIIIIK